MNTSSVLRVTLSFLFGFTFLLETRKQINFLLPT